MDFPSLMPNELDPFLDEATTDSLFAALIKQPSLLILFFETAADDETWSGNHEEFMKKLVDWLTLETFYDRLVKSDYIRAACSIQKHYYFFKPILSKNIIIKLKDGNISFNGLLLAAASDFFKQILLSESHAKERNILSFPQLTANEFAPIELSISTGNVPDLPTKGEEEIIDLLKRAKAWELATLSSQCEHMLPKYLTVESVFDRLATAKQERWSHYEQACIDYINHKDWGFRLSAESFERIAFEFLNFQDSTLEFFKKLKPLITDIICSGNLVEQAQFGAVLKGFSELFALDISRTVVFSNQFSEIPKELSMLNISECVWVSKDTIKQIVDLCPDLEQLLLKSNAHLNYAFWGELSKFKKLRKLDVSYCTQIQDSDLSLILKGLNSLTELFLNGCKRIDEKGFLELAKSLPRLIRLDLSRTNLSDTALVEIGTRCRNLTALDIASCNQLTEKGILALIKHSRSLQEVNLARCPVLPSTLGEIKQLAPQLVLKF